MNFHIHLAELLKDRSVKIKDIREMFGVVLDDKKITDNDEDNSETPDEKYCVISCPPS